jgi:hypothetical protein
VSALRKLELELLSELFAIARFDPEAAVPAWAHSSTLVSITRTPEELSVVCREDVVPPSLEAKRGFRCFAVRDPLHFSDTGILESLASPLAAAGISIFAISTNNTDYLLVAADSLGRAVLALTEAGHVVHGWEPP